jgi:aspartate ammonia-lyase
MRRSVEQGCGTRIETDHIGTVEVPADALFGISTVRALRVYRVHGVPTGDYPAFVRAYARIKKAAAIANCQAGVLDSSISTVLVEAADEVVDGMWFPQFPVDALQGGGGVATNMNVNEVLANRSADLLGQPRGVYAVVHPNDHVNRSQSTNDTYPTALNLAVIDVGNRAVDAARRLSTQLRTKAAEYAGLQRLGRTCLRDALPVGIDQTHHAQATMIDRCGQRLKSSLNELLQVPLGATAVGTGVGAPPGYAREVIDRLSAETGSQLVPSEDPRDGLQNADGHAAVAHAAAVLADAMRRIASDFRLLSSGPDGGLGEVHLPVVQAGSSMMPGKTNPAIPELVIQVSMRAQGAAHVVGDANRHGELELNVMGPVILVSLLPLLHELAATTDVFTDQCITELSWDLSAVKRHLQASRLEQVLQAQQVGYMQAK